jgi:predicted HAD superfamily Cof-like phosphohydrolase
MPDHCDKCDAPLVPGRYWNGCGRCDKILCQPCEARHGQSECDGGGIAPPSIEDVRQFHVACGLVVGEKPALLPGNQAYAKTNLEWLELVRAKTRSNAVYSGNADAFARRIRLITEELAELAEAHVDGDLAAFTDALCDLVWVVLGTAVEAGVPFNEAWAEVRRANMAKVGGKLDASGKLQKPAGWTPPDIAGVLERAGRALHP